MSAVVYVGGLSAWAALQLAWQGTLIAAAVAIWIRWLRPGAGVRCQAATACVAMLAIALVTNIAAAHLAIRENAQLGALGALVAEAPSSLTGVFAQVDRRYDVLHALAALWFVGVVLSIARLVIEAMHMRWSARALLPTPAELTAVVGTLAARMGLAAAPRVFMSTRATSPYVAGRTPGTLVLPHDCVHDDELEALVLHELAHVQRRDSEANATLRGLSALLWWHPAIWYLADEAARAREEACDEAALAHTRALVLARALVRLEERRHRASPVLAANGGALAARVRALITPAVATHRVRTHWTHAAMPALAIFAAGAGVAGRYAPASDALAVMAARASAVRTQRTDIDAVDPAGRFSLALLNGRVAEATIAGVAVARPAIHRRADRVALRSADGAEVVAVQLDPRGTIHWLPRTRPALKASAR